MQRLVVAAMHELQELHREFDVRSPPLPSLISRVRTSAGTSCSTRRRMAWTS